MSSSLDALLEKINKHKAEYKEREKTEVGKLINRILSGENSEEYWLKLSEDIKTFYEKASDEEKELLQEYDCVQMTCKSIENRRKKMAKDE